MSEPTTTAAQEPTSVVLYYRGQREPAKGTKLLECFVAADGTPANFCPAKALHLEVGRAYTIEMPEADTYRLSSAKATDGPRHPDTELWRAEHLMARQAKAATAALAKAKREAAAMNRDLCDLTLAELRRVARQSHSQARAALTTYVIQYLTT